MEVFNNLAHFFLTFRRVFNVVLLDTNKVFMRTIIYLNTILLHVEIRWISFILPNIRSFSLIVHNLHTCF